MTILKKGNWGSGREATGGKWGGQATENRGTSLAPVGSGTLEKHQETGRLCWVRFHL